MRSAAWVVQTAVAMAGIFGLGIWVGRLTAPPPGDHPPRTAGEAPGMGSDARLDFIMERYRDQLGLGPEQMARLEPVFRSSQKDIEGTRPRSQARLREITRFHERIEAELDEAQRARLREMLEEVRAKAE